MSPIGFEDFFADLYFKFFLHFSSWSVSMATDCGFLPIFLKVEFYCFQGSIQLHIVRMVPVLDQL